MTVSYFGRRVGGPPSQFSSLSWCRHVVFRWRGSVWKGVGREGLCVVVLWYALAYAIAQVCRPDSKVCTDTQADEMIEFLRAYQATLRTLLSFMLVFYYQQLYDRAKSIFWNIPWPDECFFMTNSMVGTHRDGAQAGPEHSLETVKRGRLLRATIFRYVLASTFMVCHSISVKFARIYPEPFEALVQLGLLTADEIAQIELRQGQLPYMSELFFIPIVWAQLTARKAFADGDFAPAPGSSDQAMLARLQETFRAFRSGCATALFSIYLPFPIMLSQVVTILCYSYIVLAVIAQQDTGKESEPSFHFPFFTLLDVVVYMGALRVGQLFENPLASDDDDYEIVAFFNRNLRIAHIYGLYGDPNANRNSSEGAVEIGEIELPELQCLGSLQASCLPSVPLDFFAPARSSVGAFGIGHPTGTEPPQGTADQGGTITYDQLDAEDLLTSSGTAHMQRHSGEGGGSGALPRQWSREQRLLQKGSTS